MSLRVSTHTLYSRLERGLGASLTEVQRLQGQVATGQKILKFSDDPVGATTGTRLRAQETDWAAYQRTADDAQAILGSTDGALQTASSLIRRTQELAVSAGNGAYGRVELSALAAEVRQVRDQLVDVANTQHLGRALFGGHQATAYVKPTGPWVGDDGAVRRQVSPSVVVQVNLDGQAVFGPQGALFDELEALAVAIENGDAPGVRAGQDGLRTAFQTVTTAMGTVGALMNRVTAATELGRVSLEQLRAQRSQVEEIDLGEAVMRLSAATTGYQAALAAVARADLPSLANFLR